MDYNYETKNTFDFTGYFNYEISNKGEVINLNTGRVLKNYIDPSNGYYRITLSYNGKKNNLLLHRLLALAFIPNPDGYPIINHINGIKTDNRLENLEWCNHSMNTNHSFKIGTSKALSGDSHPNTKIFENDLPNIYALHNEGYSDTYIAEVYKVSAKTIKRALIKIQNKLRLIA